MKKIFLLALALITNLNANAQSCAPRPGRGWSWEANFDSWNACTGNFLVTAPSLVHNSQGSVSDDVGFGKGWRVAMPYFIFENGQLIQYREDGTEIAFQSPVSPSTTYTSANRRMSAAKVSVVSSSSLLEKSPNATYVSYAKLTGDSSGKFVPVAIFSVVNDTPLSQISWYDSNRPNEIYSYVANKKVHFNYNSDDHLVSVSDDFAVTSVAYTYSSDGNLQKFTQVSSGTALYETTLGYLNGRVSCVSEPIVVAPGFSNDLPSCLNSSAVLGRTSMTYDSEGRLISWMGPDGFGESLSYISGQTVATNSLDLTTEYDFDSSGRLTQIIDPLGREKSISYASTAGGESESYTNDFGRLTRLEFDASGNFSRVTDPDGVVSLYTYDGSNRLIQSVDGANNAIPVSESYAYNFEAAQPSISVSNSVGDLNIQYLNGFAQLTSEISSSQAGGALVVNSANFTYQNFGGSSSYLAGLSNTGPSGMVSSVALSYDSGQRVAHASSSNFQGSTSSAFDSQGHLLQNSTDSVSGARLSSSSFTYNALGMPVYSVDRDPSGNPTKIVSVNFEGGDLNAYTLSTTALGVTESMSVVANPVTGQAINLSETHQGTTKHVLSNYLKVVEHPEMQPVYPVMP